MIVLRRVGERRRKRISAREARLALHRWQPVQRKSYPAATHEAA
jgi:hypothetical protein